MARQEWNTYIKGRWETINLTADEDIVRRRGGSLGEHARVSRPESGAGEHTSEPGPCRHRRRRYDGERPCKGLGLDFPCFFLKAKDLPFQLIKKKRFTKLINGKPG
jgi:hypothetical protein